MSPTPVQDLHYSFTGDHASQKNKCSGYGQSGVSFEEYNGKLEFRFSSDLTLVGGFTADVSNILKLFPIR